MQVDREGPSVPVLFRFFAAEAARELSFELMELTPAEVRVLGCLVEKAATTPDQYPLSTNALLNACNQKTNRDPVTAFSEREVIQAMMELRANKLCRSVASGRTDKHKHVLDEALDLNQRQLAALAIMLLRGPQTPGEIRTRTERYIGFDSVEEVAAVLAGLTTGERPLAVDLGRGPGQSQNRFMHLLGGPVDPDQAHPSGDESHAGPRTSRSDRVGALEATVAALLARVTRMETELGIATEAADTPNDHIDHEA